ncbi:MAG: isocitrate/isopropylmalate dehydrogenase family protein, partial [Kiritimatiellota bacterium]|nr:isocitrate/isopropylmalate dehydrogenase family protein [Kiritimatiellota bacterium]
MKRYRICLLPGDGVGPEVVGQASRVLRTLGLPLDFVTGEIGFGAYQKLGTPLPVDTLEKVRSADATLFGAVTTPPNIPGYFSAIIRLRQAFDLYANVRPCRSLPHPSSRPGIHLVILRENTEDLYSGIERVEDNGNRAISEMVITRKASERILRKAFEMARAGRYHKVTVVHKANVLRATCGLFLKVAFEIANEYPDLQMEDMLVDTCAMELIRDPGQFEVIVTTNMFGDILSDEASMLIGGLGVACSGNIGDQAAIFEPVHGSAPKLAGLHKANPVATFLSTAMLLAYLGENELAQKLEGAVIETIRHDQVTPDLGGKLSTEEV